MLDRTRSSIVKSCKKNIVSWLRRKTLKHSHTTRRTLEFHTCSYIALNLFYGGDTKKQDKIHNLSWNIFQRLLHKM